MKIKTLYALVITTFILVACSLPAGKPTTNSLIPSPGSTIQPEATMNATFFEAPCPIELPPGAVEGQHIVCGYVNVPETRPALDGEHSSSIIKLMVAVISNPGVNPSADPLVMLSGGPGQSALSAFVPLLAAPGMEGFYADRQIVLIEQRGTRYSTPFLYCKEMQAFKLDTLNQNLDDEEEEALKLEAWVACRDRLVASSVNLQSYNSLENAADIVAVLDALGYGTFNLYGGSYGSLLAQHIMRDYPDRLRSVMLDGVSPLNHTPNLLNKARSTDRALRLLFSTCQEDKACNDKYPDLEGVYFSLVEQLNQEPATLQVKQPETGEVHNLLLTGDKLIVMTRDLLYMTTVLPDLPGTIYRMAEGDFSLLEVIQGLILFREELADGMYNSVVCTELADFKASDMADTSDLYPKVAEIVEDLIDEVMLQPCQVWGVKHLGDKVTTPVSSDIPVLLLSGEFDPTVPPEMARVAAEGMRNAYLYTFPGVGHGVFGSDECALEMMLSFLDDPSHAPDAQCMEDLPGLVFRFPSTEIQFEAFSDEDAGLCGLVPSGWKKLGPGTFARVSSATDVAALQMVLDPGADVAKVLEDISKQFGLAETPEPEDMRQANGFSWSLYTFEKQGYPINLALAQSEKGVLILVVQNTVDESEVFYEEIFLPILDALLPY